MATSITANRIQDPASYARHLFGLANGTSDKQQLRLIGKLALQAARLFETSAPSPAHDAFMDIVVYTDHLRWATDGPNNLDGARAAVQTSLKQLDQRTPARA